MHWYNVGLPLRLWPNRLPAHHIHQDNRREQESELDVFRFDSQFIFFGGKVGVWSDLTLQFNCFILADKMTTDLLASAINTYGFIKQ